MKKLIYTLMLVFVLASCQSGVNEQVNENKYWSDNPSIIGGKLYLDSLEVVGDTIKYGVDRARVEFYQDGKEVYSILVMMEPDTPPEYWPEEVKKDYYSIADFRGCLNTVLPAGFYEYRVVYYNYVDSLGEAYAKKGLGTLSVDNMGRIH